MTDLTASKPMELDAGTDSAEVQSTTEEEHAVANATN